MKLARLEREFQAQPGGEAVERLQRAYLWAGDDVGALGLLHELGGLPSAELARRVAESQEPALQQLLDQIPDHVLVATQHRVGPARRACGCCPCCGPRCAEPWDWSLLGGTSERVVGAPVRAIEVHSRAPGLGKVVADTIACLGSLTDLALDGEQLDDRALAALGRLRFLSALRVRGGADEVTSEGVAALGDCRALKKLDLIGCRAVSEAGLGGLGRLTRLRELELRGSPWLTDAGLENLANLSCLQSLALSSCPLITGEGLEPLVDSRPPLEVVRLRSCRALSNEALLFVGGLGSLTKLDVGNCPGVTDEGLRYLGDAERLRFLDLSWCEGVGSAGLAALSELDALESLSLTDCSRVGDSGVASLEDLPLTRLSLKGCQELTDASMDSVARLRTLSSLSVGGGRITDRGCAALGQRDTLTKLSLSSPHVTDTGVRSLARLSKLTRLELKVESVTDVGLQALEGLQDLVYVRVRGGGSTTERGVQRLRAALPQARVYAS